MRIANQNARQYVQGLEIFKGSNIFSEFKNGRYIVYSYGYHFPMYIYLNNKWYANSDKYSVSTSKQQSQCNPYDIFGYFNTEQMKSLINESELYVLTDAK